MPVEHVDFRNKKRIVNPPALPVPYQPPRKWSLDWRSIAFWVPVYVLIMAAFVNFGVRTGLAAWAWHQIKILWIEEPGLIVLMCLSTIFVYQLCRRNRTKRKQTCVDGPRSRPRSVRPPPDDFPPTAA